MKIIEARSVQPAIAEGNMFSVRGILTSVAVLVAACGGGGGGGEDSGAVSGPSNEELLDAAKFATQVNLLLAGATGELGRLSAGVIVFAAGAPPSATNAPCDNADGRYDFYNLAQINGGGLTAGYEIRLTGRNCQLNAIGPLTFDGSITIRMLDGVPGQLPTVGPSSVRAEILAQGFTVVNGADELTFENILTAMTSTVDASAGTSNVTFGIDPEVFGSSMTLANSRSPAAATLKVTADLMTINATETTTSFSYSINAGTANANGGAGDPTNVSFVPQTTSPIAGTITEGLPVATSGTFVAGSFSDTSVAIKVQLTQTAAIVNDHVNTTWEALLGS